MASPQKLFATAARRYAPNFTVLCGRCERKPAVSRIARMWPAIGLTSGGSDSWCLCGNARTSARTNTLGGGSRWFLWVRNWSLALLHLVCPSGRRHGCVRSRRALDDALQVVRRIIEEACRLRSGDEVHMTFFDIETAYPRVCRPATWQLLRRRRCPEGFCESAWHYMTTRTTRSGRMATCRRHEGQPVACAKDAQPAPLCSRFTTMRSCGISGCVGGRPRPRRTKRRA